MSCFQSLVDENQEINHELYRNYMETIVDGTANFLKGNIFIQLDKKLVQDEINENKKEEKNDEIKVCSIKENPFIRLDRGEADSSIVHSEPRKTSQTVGKLTLKNVFPHVNQKTAEKNVTVGKLNLEKLGSTMQASQSTTGHHQNQEKTEKKREIGKLNMNHFDNIPRNEPKSHSPTQVGKLAQEILARFDSVQSTHFQMKTNEIKGDRNYVKSIIEQLKTETESEQVSHRPPVKKIDWERYAELEMERAIDKKSNEKESDSIDFGAVFSANPFILRDRQDPRHCGSKNSTQPSVPTKSHFQPTTFEKSYSEQKTESSLEILKTVRGSISFFESLGNDKAKQTPKQAFPTAGMEKSAFPKSESTQSIENLVRHGGASEPLETLTFAQPIDFSFDLDELIALRQRWVTELKISVGEQSALLKK